MKRMAFPPPALPTNASNIKSQADDHPADHNAIAFAVNDIVAEIQRIDAATSSSIASLNASVSSLTAKDSNLQTQIDSLKSKDTSLQNQINSNNTDISNLQSTDSSLSSRISKLEDAGWITIPDTNGWVRHATYNHIPQFRKLGNLVHVRFSLKNGNLSGNWYRFPSGYRPVNGTAIPIVAWDASPGTTPRIYIKPDGTTTFYGINGNTYLAAEFAFAVD